MVNMTPKNVHAGFGQRFKSFLGKNIAKNKRNKSSAFSDYMVGQGNRSYVYSTGKPVWSGRDYQKFSQEGYIRNVIAHRAITMISRGVGSIQFQVYASQNGKFNSISDHPVLKLLNRPNPLSSGKALIEELCSHRLISGNSYLLRIVNSNNQPVELYALRPDRVEVIAGNQAVPVGYQYTVGKITRNYMIDSINGQADIFHMKQFNPLNDWYGLSTMEAAAYAIDQHNQAGEWNQALLQNGARPSGALVVKSENGEGYLSEEQYNRVKSQIEETHSGAGNAGRPMLLEGGLEWKEMSLTPKDMDFLDTKHSAARDIALAFGVPPQMLGIPGDNTYSNMAEARLALWEQTIVPLAEEISAAFNEWIMPSFGGEARISIDKNSISALSIRREELWKRVKDADFLSDSEKREILGV